MVAGHLGKHWDVKITKMCKIAGKDKIGSHILPAKHTQTHMQETDLLEIVKGSKNDFVTSTHQTHSCQQFQDKGFGPKG